MVVGSPWPPSQPLPRPAALSAGKLFLLGPAQTSHGALPLLVLVLLALPWGSPEPLLTSVPEASEEAEPYLGQGGVAAVEVEVLAAVEGHGEGAAEAERERGL